MTPDILKNKPLVEAIFELRWDLEKDHAGNLIDRNYKLLVSRMFDRLVDEYEFYEPLPTASFPDDAMSNVVQHQFRKAENEWPVVQLGPGIITINSTSDYTWTDFRSRVSTVIDALYDSYRPKSGRSSKTARPLSIFKIILRYVNAVEFDYSKEDIFDFLQSKMKMDVSINPALFEDNSINSKPVVLNINIAYASSEPKGVVQLRFGQGIKEDKPVLLWETIFQSNQEDTPQSQADIKSWTESAHTVTRDWFFKTISGELQERFE